MKQEEKREKLRDCYERFYQLLATKQRAEQELVAVNQEIAQLSQTPIEEEVKAE